MTDPALPFPDDEQDFTDADRGFIARLDPGVVRDERGHIVWDNDAYAFLQQPCPDTAHPGLWRQGQLTARQGLYEVVPGIYQVRGLDLSNITFVEGDRGVVVIDPLISHEVAAAALELYREHRGRRPVTAVVYSHSHVDHFGGVRGVVDETDVTAGLVPVLAPTGFMEHAVNENVLTGPAMNRRSAYMYGASLPKSPTGQIGCGLGTTTSSGTVGLIAPTREITHTGQVELLDGVRMEFQLTPGTEAPSEMNFHFPQHRTLCVAENACHTMHNVLTLRGALVRDPSAWAHYLTETLRIFDGRFDTVFAAHHWPTWGRQAAVRFLEEQRDAYAYLHDQSVRLLNNGYTAEEVAEELEFPATLRGAWHVRGYYGTLSHNAKAVYQRYLGWFDGNPAHLWQHPPVESARRYVSFMGGSAAVLDKARQSFDEGDLRWVAEVVNHVLFAEPDNVAARELQASTFEQLGFGAESGPWRNFYLLGAAELREGIGPPPAQRAGDVLSALSTEQAFRAMAVRINGPRAAELGRLLLRWEFTDTAETWTLLLSNGALTPIPGAAPGDEQPHTTMRLERSTLTEFLAGRTSFATAAQDGALRVDGEHTALTSFGALFERPDRAFPVVTP